MAVPPPVVFFEPTDRNIYYLKYLTLREMEEQNRLTQYIILGGGSVPLGSQPTGAM
jgi:hypothetical protein